MNTNNYKIKFLIPVLLVLFAASCKKEKIEEVRPKTAADFEKVMSSDPYIKEFNNISDTLLLLNRLKNQPSIANSYKPKNVGLSKEELNVLNQIKTKEELILFLNNHGVVNSEKVLILIDKQRKLLNSFVGKHKAFLELDKDIKPNC